jgi:hypothetical protein
VVYFFMVPNPCYFYCKKNMGFYIVAAAYAHEPGDKTGQRTDQNEKDQDREGKGIHGRGSKKASRKGLAWFLDGGPDQIRTGDGGFADLCLTTWRRGPKTTPEAALKAR